MRHYSLTIDMMKVLKMLDLYSKLMWLVTKCVLPRTANFMNYKEFYLLEYNAMKSLTFWRNMLPPSSGRNQLEAEQV
jgi:hypothetical protein